MEEARRLMESYFEISQRLGKEMAARFPEPRSPEQTNEAIGWLRTRRAEAMREAGFRPWTKGDKED